jgi:hypothetical protein
VALFRPLIPLTLGLLLVPFLTPSGAQAAGARFRVLNAAPSGVVTVQVNGKTKISRLKLGRASRRIPLAAGTYAFSSVRSGRTVAKISVRLRRNERVTVVFAMKGRKPVMQVLREPRVVRGAILLGAANFASTAGAVDFGAGALVIGRKVGFGRVTPIRRITTTVSPTGLLSVSARRSGKKALTSADPLVLASGSVGLFAVIPRGSGARLVRLPYDTPPPAPLKQPLIKGSLRFGSKIRCVGDAWRPKGAKVVRHWTVDGAVRATGINLTLSTAAHAGHRIGCAVSATSHGMTTTALAAFTLPAVPTPVIMPSIRVPVAALGAGSVVSCNVGTWTGKPSSFAVRWIRAGTGAVIGTGRTYTLALPADNGAANSLRCDVVATNTGGPSAARPSTNAVALGIAPTVAIDPTSKPVDRTTATAAFFTWAIGGGGADTVTCSIDNAPFAPCAAPTGQSYAGLATTVTGQSHTFSVRAANAVSTATDTYTWKIEPLAPIVTITTWPVNDATVFPAAAAFAWTVGGGGAATVTCSIDNGPFAACTSPKSNTVVAPAPAGSLHTFNVRATNTNPATPTVTASRSWTVLPQPPTVTIDSAPTDTTATDATFTWTAGGGGASSFTCSLDNGPFVACTSGQSYTGLATGANGLPHTFVVRATNANPTTPTVTASHSWTVLPQPPTVTIDSGPTDTTATDATFTWTAGGGGASSFTCSLDNGPFVACTSPQSYTGLSTSASGVPHTFSVKATNATSSATATHNWVVNPPLPTVTAVSVTPGDGLVSSAFDVTITLGGGPTTSVTCTLDGGAAVACSSGQTFPDPGAGPHTMVVTATNASGDGTGSFSWTYLPPGP